jgi:hypothetical protein
MDSAGVRVAAIVHGPCPNHQEKFTKLLTISRAISERAHNPGGRAGSTEPGTDVLAPPAVVRGTGSGDEHSRLIDGITSRPPPGLPPVRKQGRERRGPVHRPSAPEYQAVRAERRARTGQVRDSQRQRCAAAPGYRWSTVLPGCDILGSHFRGIRKWHNGRRQAPCRRACHRPWASCSAGTASGGG